MTATWCFVFEMPPGTDLESVRRRLPAGAWAEVDEELHVIVVRVDGGADVANASLGVLSQAGATTFRDDRAVARHLPERAVQPADWDGTDSLRAICTSCGWSTPEHQTIDERTAEQERHAAVAHGGRARS